jgi:hypothetical protein
VTVAKPLRLRLFLEGVEVPVIAAQVTAGINAPSTASVQVVPLDEVMDFRPRTMVHLFYLDTKTDVAVKTSGKLSDDPGETTATRSGVGITGSYRLMFCGEVIGYSFVRTPMSRSIVLQCLDFSSYWDACHATAIEYGPFGNLFSHLGGFLGSNTANFDDIVNQQQEKLVEWIRSKPETPGLTSVSGLAGGIIHMLEAMGGIPAKAKGVNDFFTIAELRCRLLQQITAEENDSTAARLLANKVFDQWLRNGLQNAGQQVTFRDLMKMLFQYIYYDVVPNPVARYTSSNVKKGNRNRTVQDHPSMSALLKTLRDCRDNTVNMTNGKHANDGAYLNLHALQTATALKECHKYIEEMKPDIVGMGVSVSKAQMEINAAIDGLTRLAERGNNISLEKSEGLYLNRIKNAIKLLEGATDRISGAVVGTIDAKSARLRTQIIRPDCWFAAPPRCNVFFPEQYTQINYDRVWINEVTRSMIQIYNSLIVKPGQQGSEFLSDRVVAPSVGMDSKKLTKYSGKGSYRVLMDHERHTGIIPRVEWLSNVAAGTGSTPTKGEEAGLRGTRMTWAARIAMFHFFKYRFGPRSLNLSGKFNPVVVCGFPGAVILRPFMIPNLTDTQEAVGKDAADAVNTYAVEHGSPAQFIGFVVGFNHNVDQGGGNTSVSMTHVRRHSGIDDEFMSLFTTPGTTVKRRVRVRLNCDELLKSDDANKDKLLTLLTKVTPQQGEVWKSRVTQKAINEKKMGEFLDSTGLRTRSDFSAENTPVTETATKEGNSNASPTYCDPKSKKKLLKTETVATKTTYEKKSYVKKEDEGDVKGESTITGVTRKVDVPNPAGYLTAGMKGLFGTIAGVEVTRSSMRDNVQGGSRAFEEVVLHEDVEFKAETAVPPEMVLMPEGWFSPKYRNENIGKDIYQPFFGCDSIVDELVIAGGSGTTASSSGNPEGPSISPFSAKDKLDERLKNEQEKASKISIERALNLASYLYGVVRSQGLDVETFIQQYTDRPVATMEEMLGTADLALTVDGTKVKIDKGTAGFHTFAVHDDVVYAQPLAGLVEDPTTNLVRLSSSGKGDPIPAEYDVRREKKVQVYKYLLALEKGPAFRG